MGTNYYWRDAAGREGSHIGKISWGGPERGCVMTWAQEPDEVERIVASLPADMPAILDEYGGEETAQHWWQEMIEACRREHWNRSYIGHEFC